MGRAESAVQQILRWLCLVQATLFIFFATATGTGIVSAYLHFLLFSCFYPSNPIFLIKIIAKSVTPCFSFEPQKRAHSP
jgi:hypothetical protein